MKLCKDCKHFRTRIMYRIAKLFGSDDWCEFARCALSAKHKKPDLVCGKIRRYDYLDMKFCSFEREGNCGPAGRFWEAK